MSIATTVSPPRGQIGLSRPGLRVGPLALDSPVVVAPMVGISDVPFRAVAAEMGAALTSTEMVAAEAVVRRIPAALHMLDFPSDLRPVGAQLVGNDPVVMAEAAQIAVERGASVVDVNLGCPVRKVVGRGSGAGLARDIAATTAVLGAMVRAVDVPVTAKMRLGWDHSSINAPELARGLEDVGVALVSVHGRTRCQAYTGLADWEEIARVKRAVSIPVLGSGDVVDVETAARHVREGWVDGIIVARGMLGNFWLVRQLVAALRDGEMVPAQPYGDRIALVRRHVEALVSYWGERKGLRVGRKYVAWTVRGCAGASKLRARLSELTALETFHELLDLALCAGESSEGCYQPVLTAGDG